MIENKIHKLEDVVKPILENNAEARGDDFKLILEVYWDMGIPANMGFNWLMLNHSKYGLPSFESITRCRRKLQAMYPELKPIEEVEELRIQETATYIEYALDI